MSNPPKAKGTAYETEVKRALGYLGLVRTPPGTKWDIELPGTAPVEVLATRPDRGETLVTLRLVDFVALFDAYTKEKENPGLRIECKRYKAFSLHSIFHEKFKSGASSAA